MNTQPATLLAIGDLQDGLHDGLHQSRILIVDDSIVSLMFLRNILLRGGFSDIRTAASGEDALQLCDNFKPDIIILDLIMEGMDGFECCRRIRARSEGGDMPILIQTALTDPKDKIRTFQEGATDFITKPVFPEELYARVIVHLEKQLAMKNLQAYKQRVEQELSTARELQTDILPRMADIEAIRGQSQLDIASYFKPSSELGGDFWGIKQLAPEKIAFWIVDFSGHGVAAALNVFRLHTCLQEESTAAHDPGAYLTKMNERLLQLLPCGQFATMFYGIIDLQHDEIKYAGAGSPHPILLRKTHQIEMLDGTGLPLGIAPQSYLMRRTDFVAGDRVCFYSDALTETLNLDGTYIDEGQIATVLQEAPASADKALLQVLYHYDINTLPRDRHDDLTIGLICRQPAPGRKP